MTADESRSRAQAHSRTRVRKARSRSGPGLRAPGLVELDHERAARGRETEQDQPTPLDRAFGMFELDRGRGRVAVGAEFRLDVLLRGAVAHLEILLELLERARRRERPLE